MDLIPEMVAYATSRHQSNRFFVDDVYLHNIEDQHYDFIVLSGLFQYKNPCEKMYYVDLLEYVFQSSKVGIIANFLSNLRDENFKTSDELYLEPSDVVHIASQMANFFALDHNYHRRYADFTVLAKK
jgi:hypothetical protein